MIRYDNLTPEQIRAAVDQLSPTWRKRARRRTKQFETLGRYEEKTPIWSEIKPAFMQLQQNKCAYCETRLEGAPYGSIEHDVEHFRPKRDVEAWPPPERPRYPFPTGFDHSEGYYLLAYHLENYATACKVCNTILKKTFFPIAGNRISGTTEPADYTGELPFLIYPLGTADADPEKMIAFDGADAISSPSLQPDSHDWRRARVTIDLFELNREDLQERRSLALRAVWIAWTAHETNQLPYYRRSLDLLTSRSALFASCARCFLQLCHTDAETAKKHAEWALDMIEARSL